MKKFGILSFLFAWVQCTLRFKPSNFGLAKPQSSLVSIPLPFCNFVVDFHLLTQIYIFLQFSQQRIQGVFQPCGPGALQHNSQDIFADNAGSKSCLKYEMNNRLGRRNILMMEVYS